MSDEVKWIGGDMFPTEDAGFVTAHALRSSKRTRGVVHPYTEELADMKKMILLAVALVALIASPAAAQYAGSTLVLSDSSIAPGDSVDISCSGLEPGVDFTVTFDGEEIAFGTVADDGTVSGTIITDPATPPGTYEVAVDTDGGSCVASLTIEGAPVTNPPGGTTPGGTTPGGTTPGFTPGTTPGFTPGTNPGSTPVGAGTGAGTLARTGTPDSTRTIAMVGAGLLALGGMLTLTMRRKTTA